MFVYAEEKLGNEESIKINDQNPPRTKVRGFRDIGHQEEEN